MANSGFETAIRSAADDYWERPAKLSLRFLFAALILTACAARAGKFDGQFHGGINGTQSALVVQAPGTQLQGEIDAGRYRYVLFGKTDGKRAQGQLNDPQTGAAMMFRLAPDASGLLLTILSTDYSTGQTREIPTRLSPVGAGAATVPPEGG